MMLASLVTLLTWPTYLVEARTARQVLETALENIETPEPNQIMHYTYRQYHRPPPADLEPDDPYHLPYKQIWRTAEFGEVWLQLGPESKQTVRWRTQLRDEVGNLLQDLMFDGVIETDYFPAEHYATKFPMEISSFRDNRVALIEDFLQNEKLSRRENQNLAGQPVLSVYGKTIDLKAAPQLTLEEALLNFNRPFIADLKPVALAKRIDFDRTTNLPVGQADVVWDEAKVEHIIMYETFSTPEILPADVAETDRIFQQDIPIDAFSQNNTPPIVKHIVGLEAVVDYVDYPIYAAPQLTQTVTLISTDLRVPDPTYSPPPDLTGIEFANSFGGGVTTLYADSQGAARVLVIQGPMVDMVDILQHTKPTWFEAISGQLFIGSTQVPTMELIDLTPEQLRYVIETGETILYAQSSGLSSEQLRKVLEAFTRFE